MKPPAQIPAAQKAVPLLTAPTAAGKTALALRLAGDYEIEVVSADAFLVYRGLDIGTAKPSPQERARVPHHVVDIRDPWQDYDVTQFVADAEAATEDILRRGRVPLVVGGTGFYLSALLRGLPTTPRADPGVQRQLEEELAQRGLDALLADVAQMRPTELERLQRNPRRVVRTLEIYRRTGRWPSEFPMTSPRFFYAPVAFTLPPEQLERHIAARVDTMFRAGLVAEVERLLALLPGPGTYTALQAIGYKEVAAYLRGEVTLDGARENVMVATRFYAKRQLTWLRTQLRFPILPDQNEAAQRLQNELEK